jgi:hypothetical protein
MVLLYGVITYLHVFKCVKVFLQLIIVAFKENVTILIPVLVGILCKRYLCLCSFQ